MTGAANFNTTIARDAQNNGIGFYAVVPIRRAGEWVDANVDLNVVKNPTSPQYDCFRQALIHGSAVKVALLA